MTTEDPDWGQREFVASPDERFRPVDCAIGPDGTLTVIDMYRGILQHRQYVTTYLRKQILERELDRPLGLGRIYRVVATDRPVDDSRPRLGSQAEQRWHQSLQGLQSKVGEQAADQGGDTG